ncbi:MAG: hypothetical protein H7Y14_03730 [Burkholderiales bacterium]|nr:hypothetical protein [Burkholderiales bacterium]
MKTRLAILAFALSISPAFADVPNACQIITVEDINTIAGGTVEKVQQQKAGNPSVCGFMDSRRGAVLVLSIREVQYAVENELQLERENLEKIYKGRVKWLTAVGENGFWMPINKQLVFRKGKRIVSIAFSRAANQNEVDSSQIARLVEARL